MWSIPLLQILACLSDADGLDIDGIAARLSCQTPAERWRLTNDLDKLVAAVIIRQDPSGRYYYPPFNRGRPVGTIRGVRPVPKSRNPRPAGLSGDPSRYGS